MGAEGVQGGYGVLTQDLTAAGSCVKAEGGTWSGPGLLHVFGGGAGDTRMLSDSNPLTFGGRLVEAEVAHTVTVKPGRDHRSPTAISRALTSAPCAIFTFTADAQVKTQGLMESVGNLAISPVEVITVLISDEDSKGDIWAKGLQGMVSTH